VLKPVIQHDADANPLNSHVVINFGLAIDFLEMIKMNLIVRQSVLYTLIMGISEVAAKV
jgi:hypothetical protein